MEYAKLQDKCRGSLVGGAVGDALGYEVEFMSLPSILKRFGANGITRYVPHHGVAQFSDDTQMTHNLELEPVLVSVADDLCADVRIPEVSNRIGERYIRHLPVEIDTMLLK